jgi:hypothetical protein
MPERGRLPPMRLLSGLGAASARAARHGHLQQHFRSTTIRFDFLFFRTRLAAPMLAAVVEEHGSSRQHAIPQRAAAERSPLPRGHG